MSKDFVDELMHFTIHEDDFKQLPKKIKEVFEENRDIEFYPQGLKQGKNFDKVKEVKRLIKQYVKEIKKYDGQESNVECIIIDQILELLNRMMAHDMRKVGLEKLINE
jgi:thymidylate synthase